MNGVRYTLYRIREYMRTTKTSKYTLAKAADISDGSIRSVESPGWNPTVETLIKIDDAIPSSFKPRIK